MSIGRLSFCKTASYRIKKKVESLGSLLGCRGLIVDTRSDRHVRHPRNRGIPRVLTSQGLFLWFVQIQ